MDMHAFAPLPNARDTHDAQLAGTYLDALLQRAHELTHAAARALGLDEPAAAQAADDGGVVLNGTLVTVTPMPLEGLAGDGTLVVSATLGCRVDGLEAQTLCDILAHAPGVLAVYNAAIGCQPDGTLVVHRMVPARDTAFDTLAEDMFVTQQLAALLGDAATQGSAPQ
ncbi:type III effector protein chaperone [Ralstonia solanacearum]|uniref:Type III effector protein chaperone n=1 Tax=Ralstonia solanacearum TaxID=305 RepID=A0AAE3NKN1_RALSL|nr:type III effector protein chaperone [Ralstonia solanacearum]MBB6582259.1 type III effector protein chaperone [Ralstonia solanacearum]MDB0522739.1 type III effector protein chaperone [Ralstonia solanacearum]MDC6180448.1 type III effector protein chaperone [Ralstonia solanacearum]MDC6241085.1 type III effector protein chaperone [Ralstonia solanacearum]MDD7803716.1 type III effector protein chaperone [Ralstonia solanacearum]